MPRHTHPRPQAKHPRGEQRTQRDRYIRRRWRQAKDRYGYGYARPQHPESVAAQPTSGGRWEQVDPRNWPFYLPANHFTRNPWTRCSCLLCTWEKRLTPRRAQEKRAWQREASESSW